MSTPPKPSFMPAPRPKAITPPDQAEKLVEATKDLGFARPTVAPRPKAAEQPKPKVKLESLRIDLPPEAVEELRLQAVKRKVSIKYLVAEALSKGGYKIDLSAIPEDGRRDR